MATDPVCGMTVDEKQASAETDFRDKTYYFCSKRCYDAFTAAPEEYIETAEEAGTRQGGDGTHRHGS